MSAEDGNEERGSGPLEVPQGAMDLLNGAHEQAGQTEEARPTEDAGGGAQETLQAQDPQASRSLELLAQKEAEFRTKYESELTKTKESFQSERQEMQKQLEEARAAAESAKREMQLFLADPVTALREMGADENAFRDVTSQLNYAELGDDALPEQKAALMVSNMKREIERVKQSYKNDLDNLKAELQKERQANEHKQLREKWINDISKHTSDGEIMANHPSLKVYVENAYASPSQAHQELLNVAAQLEQQSGKIPELGEVLAFAEKQAASVPWVTKMASQASPSTGTQQPAKTPVAEEATKGAPPTLKSANTATTQTELSNGGDDKTLFENARQVLESKIDSIFADYDEG